jgi:organic radical activating enzyme
MRVYLETNGYSASRFEEIVDVIDFSAIDLKLPSHRACSDSEWPDLIENELACTRISSEKGVYTIVKIVILSGTQASEVEEACLRLRDIDAFIVLQPASGVQEPKSIDLIHFHEEASRYLGPDKVAVIPQAHKLIGVM